MKNYLYLILLLITVLPSCSDDEPTDFIGSETITTQNRSLSDFDALEVSSIIDVSVTYDPEQEVSVRANDNIIDRVITQVVGNTLVIDLEDGTYTDVSISIDIGIPTLTRINNEGTGDIDINNFENLSKLDVESIGTGNITAIGSTQKLSIDLTGTGSFRGFEFTASNVDVQLTGTGNVEINCIEKLEGSITGTGNIYYLGNPDIDVNSTGTGKVINAN